MPRPQKRRLVRQPPIYNRFKPVGQPAGILKSQLLTLDEYEALRLADYEALDQADAAKEMDISRPTFTRLIEKARKKLISFISDGTELIIEGGAIHFRSNSLQCIDCNHIFKSGFTKNITTCPTCNSNNIIDFAESYGHGSCCRGNRHRHGRRNN